MHQIYIKYTSNIHDLMLKLDLIQQGVGQALRSTWKNYIPFSGMRKVHRDLQRLNK